MTGGSARRTLRAAIAVVAGGLAASFLAVAAFDPVRNPHGHFRQPEQCPKCHVYVKGKPDPDRFLSESDQFCLGCHADYQLGRSHPRGGRPHDKYFRMHVPDEFRLDDDGRIICLTCHTAHGPFVAAVKAHPSQKPESGDGPGRGARAYYRTYYLRRSDPKDGFAALCDGCHKYL